jgi:nitroreductase
MENRANFVPLAGYREYPVDEMRARAVGFYTDLLRRRTIRDFSDRPVPREIIEQCILAAGTAPNGGNVQPWRFVVVSSPAVKRMIRDGAEHEDSEFYERRAPQEWLDVLAHLGTSAEKPYLERAPYLIAVFAQTYDIRSGDTRVKQYYTAESVGIATGVLITALHHTGLASLVHVPTPTGALNEILRRPLNERPFLLLAVGYPAEDAKVPASVIEKKSLEEIAVFID